MSIKDLLSSKANTFKPAPKFPGGNYRFIVTGYQFGTWSKSGKQGITFDLKALSSLEAEDTENPEAAEEQRALLEKFGDWTNHTFQYWYKDKESGDQHLLVSPVTFTLFNEDDSLSAGAAMFYLRDPDTGTYSGFVVDILGIDVAAELGDDPELGDVLDACVNRELYGQLEWQPNQKDPTRKNLNLIEVSSVA